MRILHTVKDWWLSEAAIKMFNALPVENEFVFFNPQPGSDYKFKVLKSVQYVKIVDKGSKEYDLLLKPGRFDLFWAHGLYEETAEFVDKLDKNVKVMWTSWGFDYLRFGVQWMYAPRTTLIWAKSISAKEILKRVSLWVLCKLNLQRFVFGRCLHQKWFKFFDRVDYFSTVVPTEEALIRKVLGPHPKCVNFHCASPVPKVKKYPTVSLTSKKMLVGHQADITVNHIDALSKIPNGDWDIYMPLSYSIDGIHETEYGAKVIEYAKKRFGEKCHPIINYMPYVDYLSLISSCSVFIFPNYRQQGCGNVSMALRCGGCVFMSPNNPVYQYYVTNGVVIYPISRLKDGVDAVIKEFAPLQLENILLAEELRSHEKLIDEIRESVDFLRKEICGEEVESIK